MSGKRTGNRKGGRYSGKSEQKSSAQWGVMSAVFMALCVLLAVYLGFYSHNILQVVRGFLLEPETSDDPVVNTKCGQVRGINNNGISVFKGIPYALPPTGPRRWRPPVPRSQDANTCWEGVYNATEFSSYCWQPKLGNFHEYAGSEDCLYVNVWTPTLEKTANLPVMVWIHGGFLLFLSGSWPWYSPSVNLTRSTNVVYVSMNYRLNAMGFMALDILSAESSSRSSGNYGFRDQILALEWVRDNIIQFGGDPKQVTVFGQSSGGTSIFALLASPMAKGLFQKAWLLSASPILNKTLSDASRDNLAFLRKTGCSDTACLRAMSPRAVLGAVPWYEYPFWAMEDQGDLPVKNVFDGAVAVVDGVVLPKAPFDAWKAGEGVDVPTIIGTTAQELDFLPTPPDLKSWTWDDYTNHVHKRLDTFGEDVSTSALAMYPPSANYTPEFAFTSLGSDLRVTCPNDVMTARAAESFKSNVWRYVVTSQPSKPVNAIGVPFASKYAFHMWDYIAFSGVIPHYIEKPSASDEAFKQTITQEMLNFVRTGSVKTSSWKPYPSSVAILNTSTEVSTGFNSEFCDYWFKNNFFSYAWIN